MIDKRKIIKITAVINKTVSSGIISALKAGGIESFYIATGRESVLQEKKGIFTFFSRGITLTNDPVDILSILVTPEMEFSLLNFIADKGKLNIPGRGSVFSEEVYLLKSHSLCEENKTGDFISDSVSLYSDLVGICCIVQRGEGDTLAQIVLSTGACVPYITFGEGTGLRDKLGLLRITIPAEKELINLVVSKYDVEGIMDMMIDAGKLDQPGKGFIYLYPVKQGIINTKVSRGASYHVASIEQIVAAIDDLKGGIEWRRRDSVAHGDKSYTKKRIYLTNLVVLTLICDEGRAEDLVKEAMAAGAPGATISKLKYLSVKDSTTNKVSPARESCSMVVSESQIENIVNSLDKVGAFDDDTHGQILMSYAPKACTYLGK